jgi:hypothetical protein
LSLPERVLWVREGSLPISSRSLRVMSDSLSRPIVFIS